MIIDIDFNRRELSIMKILKKVMSAFLAALMCIPSGILTIANATETNPNGDYTVMLTDAENGLLQFSEECLNASTASQEGYNMMQVGEDGSMNQIENDGSIWAFKEGDTVEIETIPGDDIMWNRSQLKILLLVIL